MKLISQDQHNQLLANGNAAYQAHRSGVDFDPTPVLKLFTSGDCHRWLLTDIDPFNTDRAYGLCDLGDGIPTLGYVSLTELEAPHGKYRLQVQSDPYFIAHKPISAYADEAYQRGLIIA